MSQRAVLSPAGHASVDESRVALGAFRRTEAKALHHARTIALDQRVGCLDQRQRVFDRFGALEIEGDNALSPPQRTFGERPVGIAELGLVRADDCNDLRAEIGQHTSGERTRTDPLELDNFQSCKRTHHP